VPTPNEKTYEDEDIHINIQPNMEMNQWKSLSRLAPTRNIHFTSLDVLGIREIDTSHPWDRLKVSKDTLDIAPNFINYNQRNA